MKTSTIIIIVVGALGVLYLFKDKLFSPQVAPRSTLTNDPSGAGEITAIGNGVAGITNLVSNIMKQLPAQGQSGASTL